MRISTLNRSNQLEVSQQNVRASDSQVTGTEMSPAMLAFTENQIVLHADRAPSAEANTPRTILDLLH
jgi:flagellin-like hook-associated protein FlgL